MSAVYRDPSSPQIIQLRGELAKRQAGVEQRAATGTTDNRVAGTSSPCYQALARPGPDMHAHAAGSDADDPVVRPSGMPAARLRRVTDYIEAHLGEPLSVRHLAEQARMSPSHFTTLFRRSTGISPYAYLLQCRMAKARVLLAEQALPLAEIGARLGFSSQAHFTTAFRKRFGVTPSVFRARARGSGPDGESVM